MTTKRNEQRSRAGKKLLVERAPRGTPEGGEFRDVIDYAKSSRQDQRRTTVGEAEARAITALRKIARLYRQWFNSSDVRNPLIEIGTLSMIACDRLTAARKRARAEKRKTDTKKDAR